MKLKILFITVFCTQAYAVNVMPEIRTTIAISKTDINRINCQNGKINSIDYAADTGLTHRIHDNKKNVIVLFKQLSNGITSKIIESKVNILVGCNNEYYPLILDPQAIDSQSIFLQTSKLETTARKNNQKNKTYDQVLVNLIKLVREEGVGGDDSKQNSIYLDGLQIKPLGRKNIPGSGYQVIKFTIISTKNTELVETQFLNTKLTRYPIIAVSLDDFKLDDKKRWTHLYLVIENGGAG